MNETSLALEDGSLAYLRGGQGPLVVFSHALGPLAWGPLDRLTDSCTVAIPVWERSTVPAKTMGALGWFEALTAALGFPQAALCAWSMAGPAAIYYAAERPPSLSHLILVDVAGLGSGLPPLRLRDLPHVALTRLVGHPTRGLVRAMWKNWVRSENVDTRPLEIATYCFFREKSVALEDPTDDDEDDDTVMDVLPSIKVPTLVLSGRHSSVLGPRLARTAAALLPCGKLSVFEESSHALQLEEPQKFQDALAAFVTGASAEISVRE
jgi:pimeloyl-ACP methyl ester carboxylesterase